MGAKTVVLIICLAWAVGIALAAVSMHDNTQHASQAPAYSIDATPAETYPDAPVPTTTTPTIDNGADDELLEDMEDYEDYEGYGD